MTKVSSIITLLQMRNWGTERLGNKCNVTQVIDDWVRIWIQSGPRVHILISCAKDDKPGVVGKIITILGFFFLKLLMPTLQFQMFAYLFILKELLRCFGHWPHIENHEWDHFNNLPTWHSGWVQPTVVLPALVRPTSYEQVSAWPESRGIMTSTIEWKKKGISINSLEGL